MTNVTRFVGPIPELYDRHMGPCLFEPYARELAQRLPQSARRVLEIAAGTGRVTRQLLAALPPDGKLLATDLNEPMLAVARQRVADDPRVTWQAADAQQLPIPDASVDAVVCGFGLMFVPDKVAALREMKRVLVHGGILLLSTWDTLETNPASKVLQDLAAHALATSSSNEDREREAGRFFGEGGDLGRIGPPTSFMKTPFSMSDPHELERLATEAGLLGIRVDTVALMGEAESAAHLTTGFVRGNPLYHQLQEQNVFVAEFETKVETELSRRFGDRPCKTPLSAHVLTAFA